MLDSWWPAAPATVVYHGSAPATSVAVAGEDAGHFTVRADGCTGRRPPCAVEVGFAPTAPGARRARLEIVDAAGVRHAVTLEGFLHGGTTRAEIEVLAGDVAAPPEDRGVHVHGPADARFSGVDYAPNPIVSLFVQDEDDQHEWWNLRLYAGGGQKLRPGVSYPDAQATWTAPAARSVGRGTTCSSAGRAAISSTAGQAAETVSWRAAATVSATASAGWHGALKASCPTPYSSGSTNRSSRSPTG